MRSEAGELVVEIRGAIDRIPDAVIDAVGCFDRVKLVIDTPGGDADSAIRLSDAIFSVSSSCALVVGVAGSAGAILAASCQRCLIFRSGRMMVHPAQVSVIGGAGELVKSLRCLADVDKRLRGILERKCRPELVATWWDGGEHWFSAEEALAAGLVDEIIPDGLELPHPADFDKVRGPVAPTEQERVLLALLDAIGPVEVAHTGAFAGRLNRWFLERVSGKAAQG